MLRAKCIILDVVPEVTISILNLLFNSNSSKTIGVKVKAGKTI
jgi:hypothetical protein